MQPSGCSNTEDCEGQVFMGSRNGENVGLDVRLGGTTRPLSHSVSSTNTTTTTGVRRRDYPAYPNLHDMLFCVVDYSVMCWPEPEDIERAYAMAGCHHLFRSHVEAELICRRQANPS